MKYVIKNENIAQKQAAKYSMPFVKIPLNRQYKKISRLFSKYNIRTIPMLNKCVQSS